MTAPPIPPGLRAAILKRDSGCLRCGRPLGPFELHHLAGKGMGGSLPEALRWAPINLATLCADCHHGVTDMVPGYEDWVISRFGDIWASLHAFWMEFQAGQHTTKTWLGGGHVPALAPTPCPALAEDGADIPIRVGPEAVFPPLEPGEDISAQQFDTGFEPEPFSKGVAVALTPCQAFREALQDLRHGFLGAARLADRIQAEDLWKADGCETLEEFLADPAVGMERSRFFRLAQVGRLARLLSDAPDLPALPERRWLRILPEVQGLEDGKIENPEVVQDLIQKAAVLTGADFDIVIDERRNAKRHPERPAAIPQDTLCYDEKGEIVATVKHVRVGESHHILQLAIPHEHAKIPMTITFR